MIERFNEQKQSAVNNSRGNSPPIRQVFTRWTATRRSLSQSGVRTHIHHPSSLYFNLVGVPATRRDSGKRNLRSRRASHRRTVHRKSINHENHAEESRRKKRVHYSRIPAETSDVVSFHRDRFLPPPLQHLSPSNFRRIDHLVLCPSTEPSASFRPLSGNPFPDSLFPVQSISRVEQLTFLLSSSIL